MLNRSSADAMKLASTVRVVVLACFPFALSPVSLCAVGRVSVAADPGMAGVLDRLGSCEGDALMVMSLP